MQLSPTVFFCPHGKNSKNLNIYKFNYIYIRIYIYILYKLDLIRKPLGYVQSFWCFFPQSRQPLCFHPSRSHHKCNANTCNYKYCSLHIYTTRYLGFRDERLFILKPKTVTRTKAGKKHHFFSQEPMEK